MKWKLFGFGLACLILLAACGGGDGSSSLSATATPVAASPAAAVNGVTVDSVTLARDDGNGNPGETVTSFKPTDRTFYAVVKLNRLETDLKVKLSWVAVAAAGSVNQELAFKEFTEIPETTITGTMILPQDWPIGAYRLNIYLNDTLVKSVDFNVMT